MTWLKINHIENSAERHKISLIQCSPALLATCVQEIKASGYPVVDVGFEMATFISTLSSHRYLTLDVHEHFNTLVSNYSFTTRSNGDPAVILYNIGILLEPELMLNVSHLLKETGRNYQVYMVWEGVAQPDGLLTWSSDEINYSINLNHIPIKIQHYAI